MPAAGAGLVDEPAFEDIAFEDMAIEDAAFEPFPFGEPAPTPVPEPPPQPTRPVGLAYITVTDAAGRVLFRRPATPQEVDDALRSADTAASEGEAAMDRIAHDRLMAELTGMPPAELPSDFDF